MLKNVSFSALMAVLLASDATAFMPSSRPSHATAASKASFSSSSLSMSAALIVQNKGGGHGELGFQLAKTLSSNSKITSITILQDDACNDEKTPFDSYASDIPDVKIVKASLSDEAMDAAALQSILGDDASFEYVWDNASKAPVGAGKAVLDCAKSWNSKVVTYVSSAGMYQPGADGPFPMPETTPVKESAGQNQYDAYAIENGLPLVSFRPQYIYGPKSNKYDYIDYYFDRLVRDLPIPVPGDGTQKVSLTNSEDVASLLATVVDNEEAAIEQRFFNCGSDQLVSYDDVAYICAAAAGVEKDKVMIEHYDANLFGKANFPFRLTNFFVSPDMAKDKLNWSGSSNTLEENMKWYWEGYQARGGAEKKIDFMKDAEVVVVSKSSYLTGSVYDKYDDFKIDVSNVKALKVE